MSLEDRAYACLIAGVIGDAMGTPTENLEPEEIGRRHGWVDDFEGDGTDDSIMKYLLSDALIRSGGYADADTWAEEWVRHQHSIFGDKIGRFFQSVLHTATKLRYGYLPRTVAVGNMPSSSSAMCIAPVGIVNAGHPRAAAAQAQEIASLIHLADVAFCQDGAAAVAAAGAAALMPGASVESVVEAATSYIKPWSGGEMLGLIRDALTLARDTRDYKAFRAAYHQRFRRAIACDSRETVPATIALTLLAEGDPAKVIAYGANFGRDSDTIGCMAGAICGALKGTQALPANWLAKARRNAERDQEALARDLVRVAREKAAREHALWGAMASRTADRAA